MEAYDALRALGVRTAPFALFNAGSALRRIAGREREARDTLRRYLDESTALTSEPDVRDQRSQALAWIADLEARADLDEAGGGGISIVGPLVLGGGVAVIAIGGVLGAVALVRDNELSERCGGDACLDTEANRATYDEMRTLSIAADVLLVAGGVVAAAA